MKVTGLSDCRAYIIVLENRRESDSSRPGGMKVTVTEPRGMRVTVIEPRGMKVTVTEPLEA